MEYIKYIVLPNRGKFCVVRPDEYGGEKTQPA